jgi:hypothetical protein
MATWHLDEGYHLDEENRREIVSEGSLALDSTYVASPLTDIMLESKCELSISVIQAVALDLLQLAPEKFQNSVILQDYLEEAATQVGSWITDTHDIIKLLNPSTVGTIPYLRYLGALIGVEFSPEDATSEESMRKELINAISWYKLKGTYESVQILSLIQQFTVNFYDMYTNDYSNFYMTDWFVGDEDENPPGFDSSYYKSPHFGLEVLLNKVFEVGSDRYLWRATYLNNLIAQVEKTRPVHTVPHYLLLLNPKTDELGHTIEVDGGIRTKVLGNWEFSTKYFDMVGAGAWNFDDGTVFDQSTTGFINSITKYVFGTGGSFNISSPVITGSIDPADITITEEKIVFEFILPKSEVQNGINELGLYSTGSGGSLVLSSVFPKIDKANNVELRVVVEVFKTDLSPSELPSS